MPTFTYIAKSLAGEELKGTREARDKFELARALRQEGYTLISSGEKKVKIALKIPLVFGRVPLEEKMLFARNLSVMVGAGLSLARALEVLANQSANAKFKEVLQDVANAIRRGENFSQSLERHPKVFSQLFKAMVEAGEKTGKLEESLNLISNQLQRDYDLRKRIRGAMIYPAIIVIAMVIIGALMLIYVVPTLVSTFEELDVPLPISTRVIIAVSSFIIDYFILAAIIISAMIAGIILLSRSTQGRRVFDIIVLKIPVISELTKKANSARTARTLGSLISSGVDILEAFQITEGVLQNHYYKDVIAKAKKDIEKGAPISKIFIQNPHLYPLLVGEMMSVGEETGKLSEMLTRLAVFYESEVENATKDLSTIIEPVLMIIIGLVVGFFAISMITPLYNVVGAF